MSNNKEMTNETAVLLVADGMVDKLNSFPTKSALKEFLIRELSKPEEQHERELLQEITSMQQSLEKAS